MDNEKRQIRLRNLVKQANSKCKKQQKQINILCNDIITAHGRFIDTVRSLSFANELYESIIGMSNLDNMLYTAAREIKKYMIDMNLVFFLLREGDFDVYAFDDATNQGNEERKIEQYFNSELVEAVTRANKYCDLDELLKMGLQASPAVLKNLWAVTIPLADVGSSSGCILLYQDVNHRINESQIQMLSAIKCGLSRAIRACRYAHKA